MKRALILLCGMIAAGCGLSLGPAQWEPSAFAQEAPNLVAAQTRAGVSISMSMRLDPVQGAPYSATISEESVQTLADGNRIVQSFSGTTTRDSQGRTRQDAPLPSIGNLSAENAPHIVFIMDPVARVSYTLNLTEKTAQKMPMPPALPGQVGAITSAGRAAVSASGAVVTGGPLPPPPPGGGDTVFVQMGSPDVAMGEPVSAPPMALQKVLVTGDSSADATTEDLGTQTMEGLSVTGTRTTRVIPAGQMGNDKPITTVTEVWTSPDLKTIVSSKRSDPRMGEQTFQLTNITRVEPDPSLFTVPPDFKIIDGPQKILYGVSK